METYCESESLTNEDQCARESLGIWKGAKVNEGILQIAQYNFTPAVHSKSVRKNPALEIHDVDLGSGIL